MTVDAELSMLRAFYESWCAFHSIPRDSLHRRQQEEASQAMVEWHDALKTFYEHQRKPRLVLVPNDSVDAIAADFDKAIEHG